MARKPTIHAVSVGRRIDRCCDQFEAAWTAGQRPRLEDFLAADSEAERRALFQALLALEVELSSGDGRVPELQAYQTRFPDLSDVVQQVFQDTSPQTATAVPNEGFLGGYEL